MRFTSAENAYYVYQCTVNGVVRYIGKGFGDRWLHCIQGKSSCKRLNRDLFTGQKLDVSIIHKGLTEREALRIEKNLIASMPGELYNTASNPSPYKDTCSDFVSEDSDKSVIWGKLQEMTRRAIEAKDTLEAMQEKYRQAIWVKTLSLKKGGGDQKWTTYMLMLENQKLMQRIAELEAMQTV